MRTLLLAFSGFFACVLPAAAQTDVPPPDPSCRTETQTVELFGKPGKKLTFDHYVCPAEFAPAMKFAIKGGDTLVMQWTLDGPAESEVARFWPLNGERPSQRIRALAEPATPADEKSRCRVHLDFANTTYSWTPDVAYFEDLLALQEPFSACGTFGDTNNALQYWKVIDKELIGFFWLGQDTPFINPASFRFESK